MNPRLEILLESRDLLEHDATEDEIAALWAKAVQALENSRRGLDPLIEFVVAYHAALQAGTSLLAARGYRPGGRDHHHNTFAGVGALAGGELSRVARVLDKLRLDRHEAVYGFQRELAEGDLEALREAVAVLMEEAYRRIPEAHPPLAGKLVAPPAA
jgi:hypothetical protein